MPDAKARKTAKSTPTPKPDQSATETAPPPKPKPAPNPSRAHQTSEARQAVAKLFHGARAYYMNNPNPRIEPIPTQFPAPSAGPTPALGTCCAQGGKCKPNAGQWETSVWTALSFSVDDPHYYSYEYRIDDPMKSFTVKAYGDLDCDGVYST